MSPAEAKPRAEFVDVKNIHPVLVGAQWETDMKETVTIRSHNGTVIDVLHVCADGNFMGQFGRVRHAEVGEYILRLMGRFPR